MPFSIKLHHWHGDYDKQIGRTLYIATEFISKKAAEGIIRYYFNKHYFRGTKKYEWSNYNSIQYSIGFNPWRFGLSIIYEIEWRE